MNYSDPLNVLYINRSFQVKKGHNYSLHSERWLTRFDHNHLRITRIIRCLRVLGLEEEARAFYDAISSATIVSSRSRMYWGRAAQRPLNIRPDIDDDEINERIGPKFLREFEKLKRGEQAASEGQTTTENGLAIEPVKEDQKTEDNLDRIEGNSQIIAQTGSTVESVKKAETIPEASDKVDRSLRDSDQSRPEVDSRLAKDGN